MAVGKLKVQVLNARNLANKEMMSKSDPYCMVELGKQSQKTKHIDSNLNPDWNGEFNFTVEEGEHILSLSVWDKNTIKRDNFMGYTYVSFDDCKKGQQTPKVSISFLAIWSTR